MEGSKNRGEEGSRKLNKTKRGDVDGKQRRVEGIGGEERRAGPTLALMICSMLDVTSSSSSLNSLFSFSSFCLAHISARHRSPGNPGSLLSSQQ